MSRRSFERLCEIAERNSLIVEIMKRPNGEQAIWVFPSTGGDEFEVAGFSASMRVGIVATPFMPDLPFDGAAPQLIHMLADRGYV